MTTPQDILDFWFGPLDEYGNAIEDHSSLWWLKDPEADALIKQRFEPVVTAAARGALNKWVDTPAGRTALIVTLDQFPRNIYRETPQAFAYDAKARSLTLDGIDRGDDEQAPFIHRVFFYLPLEHAEDRALQALSVACYARLLEAAPPPLEEQAANYLDYARRHQAIVDRFGHFPHRNAILNRESTAEETVFLTQPGSSF